MLQKLHPDRRFKCGTICAPPQRYAIGGMGIEGVWQRAAAPYEVATTSSMCIEIGGMGIEGVWQRAAAPYEVATASSMCIDQ